MLNALHFVRAVATPPDKGVLELRMLSLAGFVPDLICAETAEHLKRGYVAVSDRETLAGAVTPNKRICARTECSRGYGHVTIRI